MFYLLFISIPMNSKNFIMCQSFHDCSTALHVIEFCHETSRGADSFIHNLWMSILSKFSALSKKTSFTIQSNQHRKQCRSDGETRIDNGMENGAKDLCTRPVYRWIQ